MIALYRAVFIGPVKYDVLRQPQKPGIVLDDDFLHHVFQGQLVQGRIQILRDGCPASQEDRCRHQRSDPFLTPVKVFHHVFIV